LAVCVMIYARVYDWASSNRVNYLHLSLSQAVHIMVASK